MSEFSKSCLKSTIYFYLKLLQLTKRTRNRHVTVFPASLGKQAKIGLHKIWKSTELL